MSHIDFAYFIVIFWYFLILNNFEQLHYVSYRCAKFLRLFYAAGYLVFTHGVLLGDLAVVLGQDGAGDGEGEGDEQHPGTEGSDTAPSISI